MRQQKNNSRHYKIWTKEEDQVLINEIKKSPNYLTGAYKRSAKKLGRTYNACKIHWETKISKKKVCFSLVGNGIIANRKNVKDGKTITFWQQKMKDVISFIRRKLDAYESRS